jgi:hypothetical protein
MKNDLFKKSIDLFKVLRFLRLFKKQAMDKDQNKEGSNCTEVYSFSVAEFVCVINLAEGGCKVGRLV